ncbi:hypothetical protein Kfla_6997 [Kribbella flavida DSM 17836]|uniref:Uncharacterized protein n=1 Tax=Kribbella flavida (strain DSM 17836 / JCM 10339 / NBRC 14399) TaxID=479435 RepID=D2Q3W3_KRIFD|nr:hypothetical protein [Kribbella flavida]ADB35985.1 hypothetical protein Kfla_6997 [Kribbella flavida DSM 17836]
MLAGLVSAVLALAPASAGAAGLDNEPQPTNWPTVDKPTGSVSQSDPRPVSRPTVAKPEPGQGNDPRPLSWPAPDKQ